MHNANVPPIPTALAHRPVHHGLVVPWTTPRTASGRFLFGTVSADHVRKAIRNRLCGVCGRTLTQPLVLLLRESDLPLRASTEPALHPVCAAYTSSACPMIAGRLDHYRSSPRTLDPGMLTGTDSTARLGATAEKWFAVWLSRYDVVTLYGNLAASYLLTSPRRIRPV
ncbi:hypothetical protein BS330_28810 [Amycolatopsis keratiniphila subsp. nogabecina]|nr:hypothetical protein BS330_28810 [Amycolatopsis keratiniphila subsp. nogabecina]